MAEQQELLKQIEELKATVEQQRALLSQTTQVHDASTSNQASTADAGAQDGRLPSTIGEQSVLRVAARLPPFWAEKPALWFAQVESQFVLAGITQDSTKFHHVVANLDARYASEVEDIITSPPAPPASAYEHLKKEMILRLSSSAEQRIRQLLDQEELGDRKPSHFLRHLKSLAAGSVVLTEPLLRTLWLQRLPGHVQEILQAQASLKPEEMAKVADRILEVHVAPRSGAVNAVAQPTLLGDTTSHVEEKLQELARQVAALKVTFPTSSEGRYSRSTSRRRRSPSNNGTNRLHSSPHPIRESTSTLCFFHQRFGARARRCRSPCSWSENANGSY